MGEAEFMNFFSFFLSFQMDPAKSLEPPTPDLEQERELLRDVSSPDRDVVVLDGGEDMDIAEDPVAVVESSASRVSVRLPSSLSGGGEVAAGSSMSAAEGPTVEVSEVRASAAFAGPSVHPTEDGRQAVASPVLGLRRGGCRCRPWQGCRCRGVLAWRSLTKIYIHK